MKHVALGPLLGLLLASFPAIAQTPPSRERASAEERTDHKHDQVMKKIDDLMWQLRLADIAEVDKITYASLPLHKVRNPTAPGAKNPLVVYAYTFVPKKLDRARKHPLIVLPHGGVHSNFSTSSLHIVRELLEQGYAVVAPDYRGSTGYGGSYYDAIDYGGRENDDVFGVREWMLENCSFLDPKRVGIVGWSHGGMITLMNIFAHPEAYAVAYAGVPVSDLVARLGYASESYRAIFSAPNHIGKTVREDIPEYRRRSPISHVKKLATPLLIHTNTNDEDVNVLEVERLIAELKAEGKNFEYKIYRDAPGGHTFNRLDTRLAKESRQEIYRFLAKYLKPGS